MCALGGYLVPIPEHRKNKLRVLKFISWPRGRVSPLENPENTSQTALTDSTPNVRFQSLLTNTPYAAEPLQNTRLFNALDDVCLLQADARVTASAKNSVKSTT